MKILAVASAGGHWIQLMRLLPAFKDNELVFASTKAEFAEVFPNNKFYVLKDFNRNNKLSILKSIKYTASLIIKEKPEIVITTGAAPGLIALLISKLLLKKVIWVDSIANVEKLSMSGKIASYFADRIYTQWSGLATDKIIFAGNVLS